VLPVEIIPIHESLVLRARGSELLIIPAHVRELKSLKDPKQFGQYFTANALVNRPARKLFEAWVRKDPTVWKRLFSTVHEQMNAQEGEEEPKK
jgi:hypothetical protein